MPLGDELRGKRIVIAGGDGNALSALEQPLTRAGLVIVANLNDGREAVKVAVEERPDVVLIDEGLPGMEGLEAARSILDQAPTCVILLTDSADRVIGEQARVVGVAGYIPKPVSAELLIPAIRQALQAFYECQP